MKRMSTIARLLALSLVGLSGCMDDSVESADLPSTPGSGDQSSRPEAEIGSFKRVYGDVSVELLVTPEREVSAEIRSSVTDEMMETAWLDGKTGAARIGDTELTLLSLAGPLATTEEFAESAMSKIYRSWQRLQARESETEQAYSSCQTCFVDMYACAQDCTNWCDDFPSCGGGLFCADTGCWGYTWCECEGGS